MIIIKKSFFKLIDFKNKCNLKEKFNIKKNINNEKKKKNINTKQLIDLIIKKKTNINVKKDINYNIEQKKNLVKIIIEVLRTNIFITIISIKGEVIFWNSCGTCGLKGARKRTKTAAEILSKEIIEKIISLNLNVMEIIIRSIYNYKMRVILENFSIFNFKHLKLQIPITHNGVRLKKKRRV